MRLIARSTGADTDTSKDYEYTDWAAVDRMVAEIQLGALAAREGLTG